MTDPYEFQDKASALTRKFMEDVLALSVEEARTWKDGEKLMAMAIAICKAQGHEPDNIVMGLPYAAVYMDAKQTAALVHPIRPNWWNYLREAVTVHEFLATPDGQKIDPEKVVDFMGAIRDIAGRSR